MPRNEITLIVIMIIIAAFASVFIYKTLRWFIPKLINDLDSFRYFPVQKMIIEKTYRAIDLRAQFEYHELDKLERHQYLFRGDEKIVYDSEHLNYIIKDYTRQLADKMVTDGLVEIKDNPDEYHPSRRIVDLKVKVYKPDPS